MRAWLNVILVVAVGIVGGWVGYWVGHALGWSTNAEFPLRIGGGTGAILLSILVSFLSVWAVLLWLVWTPLLRIRRLVANGTLGRGTILRSWGMGIHMGGRGERRHEVGFEVRVHPAAGSDYVATAYGLVREVDEAALRPGTEAEVRYDPNHPGSVAVIGPAAMASA